MRPSYLGESPEAQFSAHSNRVCEEQAGYARRAQRTCRHPDRRCFPRRDRSRRARSFQRATRMPRRVTPPCERAATSIQYEVCKKPAHTPPAGFPDRAAPLARPAGRSSESFALSGDLLRACRRPSLSAAAAGGHAARSSPRARETPFPLVAHKRARARSASQAAPEETRDKMVRGPGSAGARRRRQETTCRKGEGKRSVACLAAF